MYRSWVLILVVSLFLSISFPAKAETWTFMGYFCGDNNLEEAAINDLNEIEAGLPEGSDVNFIILLDRTEGNYDGHGNIKHAKLYKAVRDTDLEEIASKELDLPFDNSEINMGDPKTLVEFARFCKDDFPADKYCLIVWNHGTGWKPAPEFEKSKAICLDEDNGDAIEIHELEQALKEIKSYFGKKIDVLDFDACLMGMAEVVAQIQDTAVYVTASPLEEPFDGNPYSTIIPEVKGNTTANELANLIANKYNKSMEKPYYVKAVYDMSKAEEFLLALDKAFKEPSPELIDGIYQARKDVLLMYGDDYHVCLFDLLDLLTQKNPSLSCADRISRLKQIFKSMVSVPGTAVSKNLHLERPNHGMAIYLPQRKLVYDGIRETYAKTAFARGTSWNEFLDKYFEIRIADLPYTTVDKGCYKPGDIVEIMAMIRNYSGEKLDKVKVMLSIIDENTSDCGNSVIELEQLGNGKHEIRGLKLKINDNVPDEFYLKYQVVLIYKECEIDSCTDSIIVNAAAAENHKRLTER